MKCLGLFGALFFVAVPAFAEDIEGVVRVSGSSINQKVLLSEASTFVGPTLCYGDVAKRVGRLTGMTVKASGEWQISKKSGEKTCIEAKSFVVTKVPNGRTAVVGTLGEKDGAFTLTGDDGKETTLADVPDGMRKLAGKKVILDLKAMENPAAKEVPAKVVSYSEFP